MTEWSNTDNTTEKRTIESNLGGTMRLGAYEAKLNNNSKAREIYGTDLISERHRHRYEVNNNYAKDFESNGVHFSGYSPDGLLPEIVELKDHPWFIGVQFHPELKSKPFDPHPLFKSFIEAAKNKT
jgi:CTP synthase